jgi:hypothetical protein
MKDYHQKFARQSNWQLVKGKTNSERSANRRRECRQRITRHRQKKLEPSIANIAKQTRTLTSKVTGKSKHARQSLEIWTGRESEHGNSSKRLQ